MTQVSLSPPLSFVPTCVQAGRTKLWPHVPPLRPPHLSPASATYPQAHLPFQKSHRRTSQKWVTILVSDLNSYHEDPGAMGDHFFSLSCKDGRTKAEGKSQYGPNLLEWIQEESQSHQSIQTHFFWEADLSRRGGTGQTWRTARILQPYLKGNAVEETRFLRLAFLQARRRRSPAATRLPWHHQIPYGSQHCQSRNCQKIKKRLV